MLFMRPDHHSCVLEKFAPDNICLSVKGDKNKSALGLRSSQAHIYGELLKSAGGKLEEVRFIECTSVKLQKGVGRRRCAFLVKKFSLTDGNFLPRAF